MLCYSGQRDRTLNPRQPGQSVNHQDVLQYGPLEPKSQGSLFQRADSSEESFTAEELSVHHLHARGKSRASATMEARQPLARRLSTFEYPDQLKAQSEYVDRGQSENSYVARSTSHPVHISTAEGRKKLSKTSAKATEMTVMSDDQHRRGDGSDGSGGGVSLAYIDSIKYRKDSELTKSDRDFFERSTNS